MSELLQHHPLRSYVPGNRVKLYYAATGHFAKTAKDPDSVNPIAIHPLHGDALRVGNFAKTAGAVYSLNSILFGSVDGFDDVSSVSVPLLTAAETTASVGTVPYTFSVSGIYYGSAGLDLLIGNASPAANNGKIEIDSTNITFTWDSGAVTTWAHGLTFIVGEPFHLSIGFVIGSPLVSQTSRIGINSKINFNANIAFTAPVTDHSLTIADEITFGSSGNNVGITAFMFQYGNLIDLQLITEWEAGRFVLPETMDSDATFTPIT